MRVKPLLLSLVLLLATAAQAQYPFQVLHAFTGGSSDGGGLWGSVTVDSQGDIYGVTFGGGPNGDGTVFELSPQQNGGWNLTTLHSFPSTSDDGEAPWAGPTLDAVGNLYGTTQWGGPNKNGTVFELTPGADGWAESVLYGFSFSNTETPYAGVAVDQADNVFGTAYSAYEVSPGSDGWTEELLHFFSGQDDDGYFPQAAPILDQATARTPCRNRCTRRGSSQAPGVILRLSTKVCKMVSVRMSPATVGVGASREYRTIAGGAPTGCCSVEAAVSVHGERPQAGHPTIVRSVAEAVQDTLLPAYMRRPSAGYRLYGTTRGGGGSPKCTGNLYGTTIDGGAPLCGCGVVFELSPQPDGQWHYTVLHTFVGSDGAQPDANLTIGPDGNLYGTTATGGAGGAGVVFQIQLAEQAH
jgi:uncharacterized repeat protein (TIGR03803 family)